MPASLKVLVVDAKTGAVNKKATASLNKANIKSRLIERKEGAGGATGAWNKAVITALQSVASSPKTKRITRLTRKAAKIKKSRAKR